MKNKLIIGARGSKLSLAYAHKVRKLILMKNKVKLNVLIKSIKTKGDKIQNKKISEIGGKNLFCKEIENQLIKKKIDIAVHSLKDMDSFENKKLLVGAYLKRNDPRDVLIMQRGTKTINLSNKTIGSSSKRRELQLKLINKNVRIKNIRGNIDTRVKKIINRSFDGAVLAYAGIKVLKFKKYVKKVFSVKQIIPSVGQGIIAAQCRKKDVFTINLLKEINHNETKTCALAEKFFLKTIGGDCHTAAGGLAKIRNNKIHLVSQLFSDDGLKNFIVEKKGFKNYPQKIGRQVGKELLKLAGKNFRKKR